MLVYSIEEAVSLLSRTPAVVRTLLSGLPSEWLSFRERPDGWTALDVVGHLIHGEDDDWLPRATIILTEGERRPFPPFDQQGHVAKYGTMSIEQLLGLFEKRRDERLKEFKGLRLSPSDLEKVGIHPAFGRVTLRQLLATWVAHDLNHLWQLNRILARRYRTDVGPWTAFLRIMRDGE